MAIIRRRALSIVSSDELAEEEQKLLKLKSLAEQKERLTKKLSGKRATGGILGPIDESEATISNLPKSFVKKMEKQLLQRQQKISGTKISVDTGLLGDFGAPIQKNEFKKLVEQTKLNKENMAKMQNIMGKLGLVQGLAVNPGAVIGSQALALAGKYFLPAGMAVGVAQMVAEIIVKSYGAGGINDIRDKVRADLFSSFGLDREIEIIAGRTYFGNAPTLRLSEERNFTSYTQTLRDGMQRSTLLRSEYGR